MMMRKKRIGRRPLLQLKPQQLIPSEYQECKAFWQWAQLHPHFKRLLIKQANERNGDSWFTKALLAIGLRPGLPDYQYPARNEKYIGLWIEIKRIDQRDKKKRENQEEWLEKLRAEGHHATYAFGASDAIKICMDYVNNRV